MSREAILGRVKQQLGGGEDRRREVEKRLAEHPENTRPAIGALKGTELVEHFVTSASMKGATVSRVETLDEAVKAIFKFLPPGSQVSLTQSASKMSLDIPGDRLVAWQGKSSIENCIGFCYCAIAESGSLVIRSDEGNSITQNFLADRHFVLLPQKDILDAMESVWKKVRQEGGLPRDLTLVSGPSSTGDIELQMEQGAHGPRELHIIVIGDL